MLVVSCKIIGNVMRERSRVISEKLEQEAQCGFRPDRGTCDGIWNVLMSIAKRREHGAETWVLLLDLVKAFDRVPRELLWQIMRKFGYPPKYMRVLIKLHTGIKVNFSMNGIEKVVQVSCTAQEFSRGSYDFLSSAFLKHAPGVRAWLSGSYRAK